MHIINAVGLIYAPSDILKILSVTFTKGKKGHLVNVVEARFCRRGLGNLIEDIEENIIDMEEDLYTLFNYRNKQKTIFVLVNLNNKKIKKYM